MENTIRVQPLRTFHGDEGFKTPESEPFEVSRQRFADLKANGLVEEVKAKASADGEKAAAPVANKMAATPKNKSAGDAQS